MINFSDEMLESNKLAKESFQQYAKESLKLTQKFFLTIYDELCQQKKAITELKAQLMQQRELNLQD